MLLYLRSIDFNWIVGSLGWWCAGMRLIAIHAVHRDVQPEVFIEPGIACNLLVIALQSVSGNAAKSGLKAGDTIIYASSWFGDELWPTDKLSFHPDGHPAGALTCGIRICE